MLKRLLVFGIVGLLLFVLGLSAFADPIHVGGGPKVTGSPIHVGGGPHHANSPIHVGGGPSLMSSPIHVGGGPQAT